MTKTAQNLKANDQIETQDGKSWTVTEDAAPSATKPGRIRILLAHGTETRQILVNPGRAYRVR